MAPRSVRAGPHIKSAPGHLALVKCPTWATYHFVVVDKVDPEGWVRRSHNAAGDRFVTVRAVLASAMRSPHAPESVYLARLPQPFFTLKDALEALSRLVQELAAEADDY